jgi:hypothetical protein
MSFSSQLELYEVVDQLSADDEIIELGQLHRGEFLLLVNSQQKKLQPPNVRDFFVADKNVDSLLAAYYKQVRSQEVKNLLFIETDSLSQLFELLLSNSHLQNGLLLEISRQALPNGKAVAVIENIVDFKKDMLPKNVKFFFNNSPSTHFKSLF